MPAVVVDSSVLITLAAGGQFHLLRELYTTLYVPPEVWNDSITFWLSEEVYRAALAQAGEARRSAGN